MSTWTKPLCAIYQRKTERSNLVNPAELLYSAHHKTSVLLRDVQIILNIKKKALMNLRSNIQSAEIYISDKV